VSKPEGWIGVDMDGTLSHFSKWVSLLVFGEPVWPMVERVKQWLREGYEVRICTARAAPPYWKPGRDAPNTLTFTDVEKAVQDWTEEHIGVRLPVTYSKDLHMIELWDDRCVQVEPNTGEPTTYWQSRVA
jgi:hypothetical protein